METTTARDARIRRTARWDLLRGASHGVLETIWQTFALVVAIRVFAADEALKSMIPAGTGLGMLLSPLLIWGFSRLPGSIARLAAMLWLAVAALLLLVAQADHIALYVGGILVALVLAAQGITLITQLLSRNYPAQIRGKRLAATNLVLAVTSIAAAVLFGRALDADAANFRFIFYAGAGAAMLGAFAFSRIPSDPARTLATRKPWEHFPLLWTDRTFLILSIGWMMMGFGNLMTIPMRAEYLANPVYGLNLSNADIGKLLVGVVATFRILSTFLWGWLFDRFNLMDVRILLNGCFMAYMVTFFHSETMWGLGIGAALLGVSFGGGGILWQIWVTKIAPPERVNGYMSMHVFMTGMRATAAPVVGYTILASGLHPSTVALLSACLIALSCLIFITQRGTVALRGDAINAAAPLDPTRPQVPQ